MKAAFFTYPYAFQNMGGGEVLMLCLERSLREQGVAVKFFDIWKDRVSDFDVLHVFSCQKECLGFVENARAADVPVVVHPIAFETWRSVWFGVMPRSRGGSLVRYAVKKIAPWMPSDRQKVLKRATLLFPNSETEAWYLSRHFAVDRRRMFVVPNGVDAAVAAASSSAFTQKTGLSHFVLCAGRIEPRKNQKNLVLASHKIPQTVVILGNPVKGYESYYEECRRLAGPNVVFLPAYSAGADELYSAYAAAAAVVLPAFVETPGLVGLEAGLIGKPLAVTDVGPTREYYGDEAVYLNPASPSSIACAIQEAFRKGPSEALRQIIRDRFTWPKVASRVKEGYTAALSL
jgi:glycosyltransferase involved in cell wall biosynthesis